MAKIKISTGEIGEGYQQYQSMIATIEFEKSIKNVILETELIDNEDYKEDLDLMEAFYRRWKAIADGDEMMLDCEKDVTELMIELEYEIEVAEEQKKLDEERTMKRCAD